MDKSDSKSQIASSKTEPSTPLYDQEFIQQQFQEFDKNFVKPLMQTEHLSFLYRLFNVAPTLNMRQRAPIALGLGYVGMKVPDQHQHRLLSWLLILSELADLHISTNAIGCLCKLAIDENNHVALLRLRTVPRIVA
ncbi:MAG: hypothetical protein EZS28_032673 [Streblomastix strix]|uniref:Uncharacterized protein n=1 Tax=Streblomastix strix TaxID=222440 RepID=A0A5J4UP89_9EUKA|nr:MAG: hypothetical protein EZS28_032673 [Streblomastix strix]